MHWNEASSCSLLCVFDGHGKLGHEVAAYLHQNLPEKIFGHASFRSGDFCFSEAEQVIKESLRAIDAEVLIANVGDARIVLGSSSSVGGHASSAVALSVDHSPCSEGWGAEEERALASGCVFSASCSPGMTDTPVVPTYLIKDAGSVGQPGKKMGTRFTRAIGDLHMKPCTTADPVFTQHSLGLQDQHLIIASDGLWEWMEIQAATELVSAASSPREALEKLLEESRERWTESTRGRYVDDISIIIAEVDDLEGGVCPRIEELTA